jgi:hypothetical protein
MELRSVLQKNLGVVMGRSWGGTPQRVNSGQQKQQSSAYKEDPILRFQFNEPVRRCVDNVLRYRRNNQEKQTYRQELGEGKEHGLHGGKTDKYGNKQRVGNGTE